MPTNREGVSGRAWKLDEPALQPSHSDSTFRRSDERISVAKKKSAPPPPVLDPSSPLSDPLANRVGASRLADVTLPVRAGLNAGTLETKTLSEMLVVDFGLLLAAQAAEVPASVREKIQAEAGVTRRMLRTGEALHAAFGLAGFERFRSSSSDILRGASAYFAAFQEELPLAARLKMVRPLADDPHSGVREWAWLALRGRLIAELDSAIELLSDWTLDPSPRLRRFAVESLRPRGVWCPHINVLRKEPARGLPLLSPLKAEPTKYAQDSVANWLNDAWKDQPAWVEALCRQWSADSDSPHTARIVSRALRSRARAAARRSARK